MQKPVITWLDSNLDVLAEIKFKKGEATTLKKGETSDATVVKIANNFVKSTQKDEAVFDALDCVLSVKAVSEEAESILVKEKWLSVAVVDDEELSYTQIGGETGSAVTLDIYAKDLKEKKGISGAANNGTENTANIATLNITAGVPAETTAEGGRKDFVLVLAYSYGEQ